MAEREVAAYVIGKRYDCDECGEEMAAGDTVLAVYPPRWPHACLNGHTANLGRRYPGHDVLITQEPLPRAIRKRQPANDRSEDEHG